jgi:hypothetical protein
MLVQSAKKDVKGVNNTTLAFPQTSQRVTRLSYQS